MTLHVFQLHDVATTSEVDVRRLVAQALDSASSFRGSHRLREVCANLDLTSPSGAIGSYEGETVGIVLWTVADRELTIEVLYIAPVARGLGLGESLVLRAIETARARGCRSISGRALPGDRETKNVYERTGLVSQVITVGKDLA